jgi:flagellar basal body-associated protein FliL
MDNFLEWLGNLIKIILVIAIVIIIVAIFSGKIGFGKGDGNGDGDDSVATEQTESSQNQEETTVTIVVKQDQYYIDEQEVTLTQIKEKVTAMNENLTVIIENNYASAKTWDEIKNYLEEWGISPIEQ